MTGRSAPDEREPRPREGEASRTTGEKRDVSGRVSRNPTSDAGPPAGGDAAEMADDEAQPR